MVAPWEVAVLPTRAAGPTQEGPQAEEVQGRVAEPAARQLQPAEQPRGNLAVRLHLQDPARVALLRLAGCQVPVVSRYPVDDPELAAPLE